MKTPRPALIICPLVTDLADAALKRRASKERRTRIAQSRLPSLSREKRGNEINKKNDEKRGKKKENRNSTVKHYSH